MPKAAASHRMEYWKDKISLNPLTCTSVHICSPQVVVVGDNLKITSPSVAPFPLSVLSQLILKLPFTNSGVIKLFCTSTTSMEVGMPEKVIGKFSIAESRLSKQI